MNRDQLNLEPHQKTVSYSQYSLYNQCQHRWYLDYVKGYKLFEPSIYLTFGTSFHEVFQEYLTTIYTESDKKGKEIDFRKRLQERMYENYKQDLQKNSNRHFTSRDDLYEFIEDGVEILEWIRSHRAAYFSLKNCELIGIEVPLLQPITDQVPNVFLLGYIDLILKHKNTGKYYVLDIKTSTRGWKDKEKKDQVKLNQVLFYKHFYSKELKVSEDDIDVEFFIVRRKLFEGAEFPIKRVQQFKPTQGKRKVKDAYESLAGFVKEVFTADGVYVEKKYAKNTESCKWCPYKNKPELCNRKN